MYFYGWVHSVILEVSASVDVLGNTLERLFCSAFGTQTWMNRGGAKRGPLRSSQRA